MSIPCSGPQVMGFFGDEEAVTPDNRRATELASLPHQRFVEHAALFQIFHQCGRPLVDFGGRSFLLPKGRTGADSRWTRLVAKRGTHDTQ